MYVYYLRQQHKVAAFASGMHARLGAASLSLPLLSLSRSLQPEMPPTLAGQQQHPGLCLYGKVQ